MGGESSGDDDRKHFSGLLFVAFMFIGAGVGLAFGRPDVGGAIGMGAGFLAMGIARYLLGLQPKPERSVRVSSALGSAILAAIGVALVALGALLLLGLEYLFRYVEALAALAIGLAFLAAALGLLKK